MILTIGTVILVQEPTDLGFLQYVGLITGVSTNLLSVEVVTESAYTSKMVDPGFRVVRQPWVIAAKAYDPKEAPYFVFPGH